MAVFTIVSIMGQDHRIFRPYCPHEGLRHGGLTRSGSPGNANCKRLHWEYYTFRTFASQREKFGFPSIKRSFGAFYRRKHGNNALGAKVLILMGRWAKVKVEG